MTRRLLVLGCSATKRELAAGERLPLRDLYDGPTWRVVRAFERRHRTLAELDVDLLALSAEHGLVDASLESEAYDRLMSRLRADVLARDSHGKLRRAAGAVGGVAGPDVVDEVFVVAGAVYLPAIAGALAELEQLGVTVTVAAGGIGYKLGALRVWLEQLVVERPAPGCERCELEAANPDAFRCADHSPRRPELIERELAAGTLVELEPGVYRNAWPTDWQPRAELDGAPELLETIDEAELARRVDEVLTPDQRRRLHELAGDLAVEHRAEIGFCPNHRCRRFEYRAVVTGDVELATCDECTWHLVHESGLTWKDAAAAGYRRDTSNEGTNRAT